MDDVGEGGWDSGSLKERVKVVLELVDGGVGEGECLQAEQLIWEDIVLEVSEIKDRVQDIMGMAVWEEWIYTSSLVGSLNLLSA